MEGKPTLRHEPFITQWIKYQCENNTLTSHFDLVVGEKLKQEEIIYKVTNVMWPSESIW